MEQTDNNKNSSSKYIDDIQQFAVFFTGNDATYAINISKIKAFVITDDVVINDTPTENNIIAGIATIRNEPITLLNFDIWLGNTALAIDEYKLIIFCEFHNKRVGILIKDMLNIVEKSSNELNYAKNQNSKIIYSTYVTIKEKEQLCSIFNAEKLMEDIGWIDKNTPYSFEPLPLNNNKYVLVADDSQIAREMTGALLDTMKQKYELYDNGEELLKGMEEINPDEIGAVIIDIEMPLVDGYQVTKCIREESKYAKLPIIVNSSMANDAVRDKMEKVGVDGFIAKPNLKLLYEMIKEKILDL